MCRMYSSINGSEQFERSKMDMELREIVFQLQNRNAHVNDDSDM